MFITISELPRLICVNNALTKIKSPSPCRWLSHFNTVRSSEKSQTLLYSKSSSSHNSNRDTPSPSSSPPSQSTPPVSSPTSPLSVYRLGSYHPKSCDSGTLARPNLCPDSTARQIPLSQFAYHDYTLAKVNAKRYVAGEHYGEPKYTPTIQTPSSPQSMEAGYSVNGATMLTSLQSNQVSVQSPLRCSRIGRKIKMHK
jgi:hypothetical protein